MANKKIVELMTKEMDRKDFLKYSVGVALAVVGVSGLLNTLLRLGNDRPQSHGYGAAPYGR